MDSYIDDQKGVALILSKYEADELKKFLRHHTEKYDPKNDDHRQMYYPTAVAKYVMGFLP